MSDSGAGSDFPGPGEGWGGEGARGGGRGGDCRSSLLVTYQAPLVSCTGVPCTLYRVPCTLYPTEYVAAEYNAVLAEDWSTTVRQDRNHCARARGNNVPAISSFRKPRERDSNHTTPLKNGFMYCK